MDTSPKTTCRYLLLVLGDQLSDRLQSFADLDPDQDALAFIEAEEESTHVWASKPRIAYFLSAMRHFASQCRQRGYRTLYHALGETKPQRPKLAELLRDILQEQQPQTLRLTRPGDYRLQEAILSACRETQTPLELVEDDSFLCSPTQFARHAAGRKSLRMEFFYREMRRRHRILMDGEQPAGGAWNFDASNRQAFGKQGPERLFPRLDFPPDELTREVLASVATRFRNHPGDLSRFAWPVTRTQALAALDDFVENHLPNFGQHQDAMWTGEPFLSHSLLSPCLNLKLLDPLEVIQAAETAYRQKRVPIESAEGFIRQILGWREYARGIYWRFMPEYLERNALQAHEALPAFYWTGQTEMRCLREVIGQTLETGYAHHIQRLMVTGLYSLLLGVKPQEIHQWYLAVYVDAVEWVELPNTLGMSQYADGGVMASKPYIATGKYIQRMSNYCQGCRFNPNERLGENACPFTTLYWDFLDQHRDKLRTNPRLSMQLRNLDRLDKSELAAIRRRASHLRQTSP